MLSYEILGISCVRATRLGLKGWLRLKQNGFFAEEARSAGKSARTRAALLDAAVSVIAQKGVQGASASEIARVAGIANGTFYLHFRDKEELISEAAVVIAARIVREMDERMSHVDNAIDRIVCGTRSFLQIMLDDRDLGKAMLNAFREPSNDGTRVGHYLRSDIKLGVEQGVFDGPADDLLVASVRAVITMALAELLIGTGDDGTGPRAAELQLRMLGVDAATARRSAWQPLSHPQADDGMSR